MQLGPDAAVLPRLLYGDGARRGAVARGRGARAGGKGGKSEGGKGEDEGGKGEGEGWKSEGARRLGRPDTGVGEKG